MSKRLMVGVSGFLILSLVLSGVVWGQAQSQQLVRPVDNYVQPTTPKVNKPKPVKQTKRQTPVTSSNLYTPKATPKQTVEPSVKPAPKAVKSKPVSKTRQCMYPARPLTKEGSCDNSDPCDPTTIKDPELHGNCAN